MIIAFCSPVMGSGKSEAARHLVERHGFTLLKFAAPLKDMTRALLPHLGVSDVEAHVEGDRKQAAIDGFEGLTTRKIMQSLGTEWGRETIRQDFWTKIVYERCLDLDRVVIDDMRFLNEYNTIMRLHGKALRIVRAGVSLVGGTHASEGELDDVPMPQLLNNSTLANFHLSLDRLVETGFFA